ncbi:MAG: 2-C-methyl-D-erythritol 2,4-cyclodiphosphate synthase [Ignavibacteria bacterium]|nr:2-C-methyl-D-erythritol 2,4-cyclodiphosphate synthase [Ignavibacteria bacterium]
MVGFGFDVHRLAANERLVLGGVEIQSDVGTVAHSDGDVVLHALVDALLGSLALGDIGEHFPDSDPSWKGASSTVFVEHALNMVTNQGFRVVNVDATIVLEQPKLAPYKNQMRKHIAAICSLPVKRVSIKATTSEHLGFVGRGEGVQAWVICEVQPQ